MLDVAEQGHADDGVDERDQGQQGADIEQGGQRDHQREEQLTNTFGRFYKPQNSTDSEDANDPQQGGRDRKVLHHVLHDDADDGGDDEDEVEDVPAGCEVLKAQAYDFNRGLQRENGGEERVADLQGEGDDSRLVVVFDAHADHVQENQYKNSDFEPARIKGKSLC